MAIKSSEILIDLFKNNHAVLHGLVDGISQADSLLQLPFEGNCLNWVVGHILDTYNTSQGWLGMPAADADFFQRTYGYGSEPMTDPAKACSLEDMLKRLDAGVMVITAQLECTPPVELERPTDIWIGTVPLIEALHFMLWHATYHTGQLEQLQKLPKQTAR